MVLFLSLFFFFLLYVLSLRKLIYSHDFKDRLKDTYICITESLWCTLETNTTLLINYTPI